MISRFCVIWRRTWVGKFSTIGYCPSSTRQLCFIHWIHVCMSFAVNYNLDRCKTFKESSSLAVQYESIDILLHRIFDKFTVLQQLIHMARFNNQSETHVCSVYCKGGITGTITVTSYRRQVNGNWNVCSVTYPSYTKRKHQSPGGRWISCNKCSIFSSGSWVTIMLAPVVHWQF